MDDLDEHIGIGIDSDYNALYDDTDTVKSNIHIPISSDNVGYQLLLKMGWTPGIGLGRRVGRVDPIPFHLKHDLMGVGKAAEYDETHIQSTEKRRALQSEVIAAENEEQRLKREASVAKETQTKEEVKSMLSAFYCDLCNKQYTKIAEYEAHLSSYDHHHKKRFKEMQDMLKGGVLPSSSKKRVREDKEKTREERELKRLQEAALAREQQRGCMGQQLTTGLVASQAKKVESVAMPLPMADAVLGKLAVQRLNTEPTSTFKPIEATTTEISSPSFSHTPTIILPAYSADLNQNANPPKKFTFTFGKQPVAKFGLGMKK
jgi:hypothetical protein